MSIVNVLLGISSYPYMVFEPASTLLMKKFSPSFWMSRIMISWVCSYLSIEYGREQWLMKVTIGHRFHVSGSYSELYRDAALPVFLGAHRSGLLPWSSVWGAPL